MRPSYFLVCALLSPAVTGCSDSLPTPPVSNPPQPTAVHIKSGKPPLLVAYRDGFDTTANPVSWTVADKSTDLTNVTFMAKTAYSIAVVCQVDANTVLTWESLRVVKDDISDDVPEPIIETPCKAAPPARRTASGTMVQQGFVHLGDADQQSTSPNWNVNLLVNDGKKLDLVATSDLADPSTNKTLIRRDIMISGNTSLGTIDVASGAAQDPVDIALDSPPDPEESTETVTATVDIKTKNNSGPARVSHATYDLMKKSIKLFGLKSAALMDGDEQTVTFTGFDQPKGTTITTTRSVTRPFKVGDDVATGMVATGLPSTIETQGWKLDCPPSMPQCSNDKKRLSVALPALPALDTISIELSGTSATDPTQNAVYQIDITQKYFGATALARPLFDTDLMGFDPKWKIDFTKQYSRQITTEHDKLDDDDNFVDHETSQFLEDVKP